MFHDTNRNRTAVSSQHFPEDGAASKISEFYTGGSLLDHIDKQTKSRDVKRMSESEKIETLLSCNCKCQASNLLKSLSVKIKLIC